MEDFRVLEAALSEMIVVSSYYTPQDYPDQQDCKDQYIMLSFRLMWNYPNIQFLSVECPSPVCDYLNVKSFVGFAYYKGGSRKGNQIDGLDLNEYLQKSKEIYG